MKADFARVTFDPSKHYAGVLHQQGRVWLDADWNEAVFDRLHQDRLETLDVVGGCGAPDPGTAFAISPNPDPNADPSDFLISGGPGAAGRYYVDGILGQLDQPASYLSQPDLPDPPKVAMPATGGTQRALVYLEVWRRLITYLQDPELREVALGGPDTATRIKTIAQVKVRTVQAQDGLTCATSGQFLPPATGGGTLTTLQPVDSQAGDLCRLPDPANYTGRENHLYRVEIHDGGDVLGASTTAAFSVALAQDAAAGALELAMGSALTASQLDAVDRSGGVATISDSRGQSEVIVIAGVSGTSLTLASALSGSYAVANGATVTAGVARFKWSRDNAAFAVQVTDLSADRKTLTVSSLGRDRVTALGAGDLVEVCDDASDLGPARGFLTQLSADPDPDLLSVSLVDALPGAFDVDRHLTLRRWDGVGWARASFDPMATPDLDLGNGVHLEFGGADLRPGDYWQFAARSADGSVEKLDSAPPRGIVRHYCPLAVVEWRSELTFDAQTILEAAREAGLSEAELAGLKQGLDKSGASSWTADEVAALAADAGATATQVAELEKILIAIGKERGKARLRFDVVDDCRDTFDPLTRRCCDCTITVAPGDSLAEAFAKVGQGGVICLLAGTHDVSETVSVVGKTGLTVRGAGSATLISGPTTDVILRFEGCDGVVLRDFAASSGQETLGASAAPGPAPVAAGAVAGVFSFVACRDVRLEGCAVTCLGASGEGTTRACVAFQPGEAPPAPGAPGRLDATGLFAAAPGAAAAAPTSIDLALRDCRLVVGTGQIGAVIQQGFGARVEESWIVSAGVARALGLTDSTGTGALTDRGSIGLLLAAGELISAVDNRILGFDQGIVASSQLLSLQNNLIVLSQQGIVASGASLTADENVIATAGGVAIGVDSPGGTVVLRGNSAAMTPSTVGDQTPGPAVEIVAQSAVLTDNDFQLAGAARPRYAARVRATTISYTANRSVCDALPTLANVVLLAPGVGSVAAVASVCREPSTAAVAEAAKLAQEVITAQDQLVAGIAAGGLAPNQIVQQTARLDRQWQSLGPQIDKIIEGSEQISLLVVGGAATTGSNRLSYTLQRLGRGADTGSVIGVF